MVEKNMMAVADYNYEEKLKFLRGMAFNNAAVLLSGRKYEKETLTVEMVFDLAEQLFDEAIKRNYLDYGKVKEATGIPLSKEVPAIPVAKEEVPAIPVVKVEQAFPELKVDLTEKEGSKMGVQEEEQELMI